MLIWISKRLYLVLNMRRKNKIFYNKEQPVQLFREDLIEIESILKECTGAEKLTIAFDSFETETINQIPETQSITNQIAMRAFGDKVSISFEANRGECNIYIPDSTLITDGGNERIKILLKNRTKLVLFYFRKIAIVLSFILANVLLAFAINFEDISKVQRRILLVSSISGFGVYSYLVFHQIKNTINFSFKKSSPTYFERNKDHILNGLLTNFAVAVVSFLLGKFL